MSTTIPSAVPRNFEKLKGQANYSKWKFTIRYHLEDRNLYDAYTKKNAEATTDRWTRSAIISTVSCIVIKKFFNCKTAKSMWDRLQNLHEDNNTNYFITLNQEMFTKNQNCKDMAEYIEKMHSIGNENYSSCIQSSSSYEYF